MSLKAKIQFYLEKHGYMSLLEAENLCKSEGQKLSNLERRCRELMAVNPSIKANRNAAGAITGYKYERFNVEKWQAQFIKPLPVNTQKELF